MLLAEVGLYFIVFDTLLEESSLGCWNDRRGLDRHHIVPVKVINCIWQ